MPKAPPKLEHVRWVRSKGKLYAYFNSGKLNAKGRAVYLPMPPFGTVGFYDSYTSLKGARTKREASIYSVADLVDAYEGSANFRDLARRSQDVYRTTLKKITSLLGKFPANDLTSSDVQFVLDNEMEGSGAHNMFLSVIGSLYAWGRSPRGGRRTDARPTEGIAKRKGKEHQPWPDHVVEAALKSTDDEVRLAVHLLYFTGQRIGDVLNMRWSDIRDDMIEVVQQKTKKTVWVPFLDELRDELEKTPKRGLTIIANAIGQRRGDDKVREILQAFTRSLGVETVPHGLRKNAVNALLEAACTVAETSSITGQSYKMVEHYAKQINQRRMAKAAIIKLENKRATRKPERKQV